MGFLMGLEVPCEASMLEFCSSACTVFRQDRRRHAWTPLVPVCLPSPVPGLTWSTLSVLLFCPLSEVQSA